MILGGGPNRIGQGIEFDYCCFHATMQLKEMGYETFIVYCNPETVSINYDTSDKLYFEPVTTEDVLQIYEKGKGRKLTLANEFSVENSRVHLFTGRIVCEF